MNPHDLTAETEFSIEFYDLDPMDIVWHGNYIKYFEVARCTLLDKIDYGYKRMEESGFKFPVTDVSIKYIKPLKFRDRVRAKAILDEYENCLRIRYELYNAVTGELTTKGRSTQMTFSVAEKTSSFVCPPILISKVESYLSARSAGGAIP
jgi:acyl-CoA thioester hydrolase